MGLPCYRSHRGRAFESRRGARSIRRSIAWSRTGSIRAQWGTSENNRRARYYSITAAGRKQLDAEQQRWAELTEAVGRMLRFA